ncbi:MAG: (deoxy)nucleoside triphosphate pyrophosphohydrolase [Draconibacterium sp.]
MIQVTCAIIVQGGKILLAQNRADADHAFQWEFPGGKIHGNESKEACIVREIREKLEIEVAIIQRLAPVEFDYGHKQICLIPFLCAMESDTLVLNDHLNSKWCEPEELLQMDLSGADRALLEDKSNWKLLEEYARKQQNYP